MLINIAIVCLIQSTLAIFHHHHQALPHNRIYVCLTPPNTMHKVQKHILECQNEVKSNIFHEAFSLIHHTAFHHPHDHSTIEYKDEHDEFAHRNFSLTEQEILKFFESHDHNLKATAGHTDVAFDDLHLHDVHGHGHGHEIEHDHGHKHEHEHAHAHAHHAIDAHPHHHSIDNIPHAIDEHSLHHHSLNEHLHQPHAPQSIVHYPHANLHEWQKPYPPNAYEKTDAVQQTDKPEGEQRLLNAITAKRNPYTYFDIQTGTTVDNNQERLPARRSGLHLDIHSDVHHHDDVHHSDIHHDNIHHDIHHDIHPTTFKDKRIAGCLMHCLYEKDHAIDPHSGYPTLDGLVNFYSDGVHEHGFFMTTLRAVDTCLKGASHKYHINRHVKPDAGVSCDLAFDIFDCVSDHITEYCTKHHYHNDNFHKGHHHPDPHHHHHPHPDHHVVDNDHYGHYGHEEEYHEDYYYS